MIDKLQVDHLDLFLPIMQKDQKVQFKKEWLWMPKVGIRIIFPEMTICNLLTFLFSLFIFLWFIEMRLTHKIKVWHWLVHRNWFW